MTIKTRIININNELPNNTILVAVSKTKPVTTILEAYNCGQRVFGENKVQELIAKQEALPKDIVWHMIGHLQRNKVKYLAPFVDLIHGIDSLKLLIEVNKQAKKHNRVIKCLLQIHIAQETSKFGMTEEKVYELLNHEIFNELKHIKITGLMAMATNTNDEKMLQTEFRLVKELFETLKNTIAIKSNFSMETLSIGMSNDYKIAVKEGSTMVRIGSGIFGERN